MLVLLRSVLASSSRLSHASLFCAPDRLWLTLLGGGSPGRGLSRQCFGEGMGLGSYDSNSDWSRIRIDSRYIN
jgi:hypothetical protein